MKDQGLESISPSHHVSELVLGGERFHIAKLSQAEHRCMNKPYSADSLGSSQALERD